MKKIEYSRYNSFKLFLEDITKTRFLKGNYLKFFIERLVSYYEIFTGKYNLKQKLIKKLNIKGEIIIKTNIGKFYAKLEDDSLNKYSPYFEYELQHWFSYDKRKEIFLDIGANRGRYSIQALTLHDYKKSICFEPLSVNLDFIYKNIKLNKLEDRVVVFKYGLSNEEKEVTINYNVLNTGIASIEDKRNNYLKEKIKLKNLDFFMNYNIINPIKVSFIKIDVEGHEYYVLLGGKRFFKNLKTDTYLMIEIWNTNKNKERTLNLLKEFGFTLVEKIRDNYLYKKVI